MNTATEKALLLSLLACGIVASGSALASDRLFVHPSRGQTDQQQADDRYDCHRWAVAQTGYDPTRDTGYRGPVDVRVPVPDNTRKGATGKGLLAGAAAGAVLGAIDDHPGRGAAIGAMVGAIAGSEIEHRGEVQARASAEAEARARADAIGRQQAARVDSRYDYRRALVACLEGRGYTVR